ncbi:hypothetical protein [Agromyces sp. Soil535]|uniref:hypothetical protein n=1 Tax=Agromyces sp. Soil535 TaxID=1736390 RepID=UPI0006FBB037|nr:hypothetical protein [Agromyces sp. Soil535]KRE30992.1 hypothetical protein ASG80_00340 [Agromyces sp. Soil535]
MTTNEWVAVFVAIVSAIATVVGGAVRSSRASQLRKAISDDLAIVKSLPRDGGARPALEAGIKRQSAELAALVLHPMRASVLAFAFLAFVLWGVVLIVYLTEGWRPLAFAEGVGRGLTNWAYVVGGLATFALFLRGIRRIAVERKLERARILEAGDSESTRAGPPARSDAA